MRLNVPILFSVLEHCLYSESADISTFGNLSTRVSSGSNSHKLEKQPFNSVEISLPGILLRHRAGLARERGPAQRIRQAQNLCANFRRIIGILKNAFAQSFAGFIERPDPGDRENR